MSRLPLSYHPGLLNRHQLMSISAVKATSMFSTEIFARR